MSTYVIGDIHGEYEQLLELLKKMKITKEDTLYIIGDILDRGPHPIKAMLKLMSMPNVINIVGNHEVMALECLKFLNKEITDESIAGLDKEMVDNLLTWQCNGSVTTVGEFKELDAEMRQEVIDYISDFSLYEEAEVNGNKYLLVHAGIGNFSPEKSMEEYSLHDLVWDRPDYGKKYFEDTYLVTGHTPTQIIESNKKPGKIYRDNNHIALDCGACFPGGKLAGICLETGKEYYSSGKKS
ncbi:serine/threonine protein phosphatase 1 [Acetitomaculum ruminis DSM 5522]|uniref:Serine/threonine protein phosphatase 1 n=1 Tax=Acetitomaculum ruminis DSM 5522 TaxID=1120918 RepID=A0A1I0WNB2_9FIRM|nr:metallophosphoesterase [Acetitomaculum ruminis]SFA90239.1 serine/threonine protein phosphatase 1 [Acetitomaculum ruminis DSM 5522]